MVLEQEEEKGAGCIPPNGFRHLRNAVSHPPELRKNTRAFLRAKIGSEQLDPRDSIHARFLEEQSDLLLEEARRIVEEYYTGLGLRFWSS